MMHSFHWSPFTPTGMAVGLIIWSFFLAFLAALAVFLVRLLLRGSFPRGHREDNASEILKKRYARGEITREQFQQMKQDIRD